MMLLCTVPQPKPGTLFYKLAAWFVNNMNWCEGYYYGTETPKPENRVYNFFYKYWLFPFENTGCACCAAVRGLVYGFILGGILL